MRDNTIKSDKIPVEVKDEKESVLEEAINKVSKIEATKEVSVIVHMLNVRDHANTESKIVTTVRSGDKLKVEVNPVGEFYKVVEPVQGYVMRKFVG